MFLFFIFTLEMKYNFFFTKFFLSITLESLFTLILHFTGILENGGTLKTDQLTTMSITNCAVLMFSIRA